MKNANILLEDGTILKGKSFGADKTAFGEIVFNTGMSGYQEILTDPSYAGQIVVMTYPLIGNYGINSQDVESDSIKTSGFIVKEYSQNYSNFKSQKSLCEYLKENNIPAISSIDTRMLTKKIRNQGTMNCLITTKEITPELRQELKSFIFPKDIVSRVSGKIKSIFPEKIKGKNKKIGIVDLGVKKSIINCLTALNCELVIFPWDVSSQTLLSSSLDAVLFSNGPGDPKDAIPTINTAKEIIGKIPIFCICLGHQILSLALGADTYKLKFGHRGSNHPVLELKTNKVTITSQNHGYAVCDKGLPNNIEVTHKNVNDNTIEGFCCPNLSIYSIQFHPEAGPGPRDAKYIFKEWIESLCRD